MKIAIYARVSTGDQHAEKQIAALREYAEKNNHEIFNEYIDIISGTTQSRPEFNRLLLDMRCYRFQAILRFVNLACLSFCVWRLVMLEKNEWFSPNDSICVAESKFSFRRLRRNVRRFVIKQLIFSTSNDDEDLPKIEGQYQQLFRFAA